MMISSLIESQNRSRKIAKLQLNAAALHLSGEWQKDANASNISGVTYAKEKLWQVFHSTWVSHIISRHWGSPLSVAKVSSAVETDIQCNEWFNLLIVFHLCVAHFTRNDYSGVSYLKKKKVNLAF